LKFIDGCKVFHYTLVELKSNWLQNPNAHMYRATLQKACKFST